MSAPYLRFMNGDTSLWDFIAESQGQQVPQGTENQRRGGPHGPGAFNFGFPSFDGTSYGGPWGNEFTHRPHPRHRGPRGPHGRRGARGGPSDPTAFDHNEVTNQTLHDDDAHSDAITTTAVDDDETISMHDNEKGENVPDPDISTPHTSDNERDGKEGGEEQLSGSDEEFRGPGRRGRGRRGGPHRHARGGWVGPDFGGRHGFRGHHGPHGPHGHHGHPFGPGMSGHGPMPWGRRGFGGRRGRSCLFPFGRQDAHHGGPPNFPDLLRAFAADNFTRVPPHFAGYARNLHDMFLGQENGNGAERDVQESGVTQDDDIAQAEDKDENPGVNFRPAADIYDAPDAYIVHLVLPGARKEDISLNWDPERRELSVAGVIARDGDEKMLQGLALAERDVGVFERKVTLGMARVDDEAISARMDNGILIVSVPKKKEDDSWTEVREIDIL